jgi:hypothetical protein
LVFLLVFLFPNSYTILFWEFYFLPFSVHVQTKLWTKHFKYSLCNAGFFIIKHVSHETVFNMYNTFRNCILCASASVCVCVCVCARACVCLSVCLLWLSYPYHQYQKTVTLYI